MITTRTVNVFGFISIAIMVILLLLIWQQLVPRSLYIPFFLIAIGLFIVRIVLRVIVARAERGGEED
jgi:hypothetical protein